MIANLAITGDINPILSQQTAPNEGQFILRDSTCVWSFRHSLWTASHDYSWTVCPTDPAWITTDQPLRSRFCFPTGHVYLNSKKQTGLLRLYKAEETRESSRLECYPAFGQTILGIGTNRSAFIFGVKRYKKKLFDSEDEGTKILRNIRHYSPNTTAQHT